MDVSTGISVIAVLIAAISAFFSFRAASAARRSNDIAADALLLGSRQEAFVFLRDFLGYCAKVYNLECLDGDLGRRSDIKALKQQIHDFKEKTERLPPVHIPEVEELIRTAMEKAWEMQRVLGSFAGLTNDSSIQTAENTLSDLSVWFGSNEKRLPDLFKPYYRRTEVGH